jgi:hypothetical protein
MNRASLQMRSLAKRLVADEPAGTKPPDSATTAASPASEKLRPHLALLMGIGGFRALLLRALALAGEEAPWLRAVRVKADGSMEGLEELPSQPTPSELLAGRVVLLAQLLGLLVAFIGPGLTSRLVRETWPQISPADLDFSNGGKHEKEK